MPYIKPTDRDWVDSKYPRNPGELNYALTKLCRQYITDYGESYQHYNDLIGALEGCKLELYRRRIATYEDKKILENTDVY